MESAAHQFHRLTSYTSDRHWFRPPDDPAVRGDFRPMLAALRPPVRKAYPDDLTRIPLPADLLPRSEADIGAVPGINGLSWLLHWSAGVVRERADRLGRPRTFRAAGSAGNLQPVEVYVYAGNAPGLPSGVWNYDATAHELIRIGVPVGSKLALILTGVPWRSHWQYAERGYRHVWWDAGSIASHLEMLTEAARWPFLVQLSFPDHLVAAAVGAEEHVELPLAVIHLDRLAPRLPPSLGITPGYLGTAGPAFRLAREAHDAGLLTDWEPDDRGASSACPDMTPSIATALEAVRRRGATRRFSTTSVDHETLGSLLAAIMRPLRWDSEVAAAELRVLVHRVDDLAPGCYAVRPGSLAPVLEGDLRSAAIASCLDQRPAGECAFTLLIAADLDRQLAAQGQRGYRALQLYAGVVAGRTQLAAAAAGLASTPLTVRDEVAARFVPDHMVPLLAVSVGHPASAPVLGGLPRGTAQFHTGRKLSLPIRSLLAELPKELAARALIPASCQAIYVVGSVARGWESSKSDLDVVIVAHETLSDDNDRQYARIGREPDFVWLVTVGLGDRSCGIEFWRESLVDKLISRVSWAEFEKGQARERQFMIYEINFLERLRDAISVYGHDNVSLWQERLRQSAFQAMRVKFWAHEATNYRKHALGQLEAGDTHSAVLSVRLFFGAAVDALLASHGELGQNAKWRARRLLATSPQVLPFRTYWEVETMRYFDERKPEEWVRSAAEAADGILLEAQEWLARYPASTRSCPTW